MRGAITTAVWLANDAAAGKPTTPPNTVITSPPATLLSGPSVTFSVRLSGHQHRLSEPSRERELESNNDSAPQRTAAEYAPGVTPAQFVLTLKPNTTALELSE